MLTAQDWHAKAQSLSFRTKAIIAGQAVDAASGETFERTSPVDGRVLAHVAAGDEEDIDRAVKAARAAFDGGAWSRAAPQTRKKILQRFAALIADHAEELALLETLDMGKPISVASRLDIPATVQCIGWFGEALDKIYDEIAPAPDNVLALVTHEPMGVVGAVVPWNYPLLMAAWKFAPALAAGNSVVLKPAEQSPFSALRVAELALEAGLPDGVFNVVPGFGETAGQALGRHMDVDLVTFTGSTAVGKLFLRYAGESNMKAVSLECGGKSPNIVFADAGDLDYTAEQSARAIFFNSGQVCTASSRLLVEDKIHDVFLDKVKTLAETWAPGDPLDPATKMGSVVDAVQMRRVLGYVDIGQNDGAKLATGGRQVRQNSGGYYVEPTVFEGVSNTMTIAREEIFGPVLAALPFKDAEDAIRIANDTIYGLQAALWTRDIDKALRTAKSLRAGTVLVNNTDGGGEVTMPFGGYKQSGIGRDNSLHALRKYTELNRP